MKSSSRCNKCGIAFTDGTPVLEVIRYTVNSKIDHGHGKTGYVHVTCPTKQEEK